MVIDNPSSYYIRDGLTLVLFISMYGLFVLVAFSVCSAQVPANLSTVLWNYDPSITNCADRTSILADNSGLSEERIEEAFNCEFDPSCSICTQSTVTNTVTESSTITETVTETVGIDPTWTIGWTRSNSAGIRCTQVTVQPASSALFRYGDFVTVVQAGTSIDTGVSSSIFAGAVSIFNSDTAFLGPTPCP